jgi:ABC-type Zn uptake system ZnuABC Zn-binding protein ZnuA
MIAWGIITVSHYLNEYYPDWSSDLRNNAKKFYEKMNELLNVSKIKSFLDKYP